MAGMTYVMQGLAVLLMLVAAVLMYFSIPRGEYFWGAVQFLMFAVNAGLFYWQGTIRAMMH